MKKTITIMFILTGLFISSCDVVKATPEECKTSLTLAQAVVDRGLKWNQVLVCDVPPTKVK